MNNDLIRIMCPNLQCQRVLGVPEGARGRLIRCRACTCNILVPELREQIVQGTLVQEDSLAQDGG